MSYSTGITTLDVIFAVLVILLIFYSITRRRISRGLRLPPGPPGMPIVGNVADMPRDCQWKTFDRWAKEYGGLVYIEVLGKSIIFVNSLEVARDLFEKRSSIYSDRPHSPMIIDLMGWGWNFGLMPYGDLWRRHRKMFYQHFGPETAATYHDIEIKQTRAFLQKLQESPAKFVDHIRHLTGAIIMEIVYGIKVLPQGDPYIEIAERAAAAGSEAAVPGKFLVEILPFLKYVPEWMPGAGFRRKAREWRVPTIEMSLIPFMAVKNALDAGTAQPSVAATMIENLSHQNDAPADGEALIRNVAGVAYAAGADTTVSVLTTFMLAMVLYPEVQRKARAELDAVIGSRLPNFEDLKHLQYVTAICKEVHRWHPVFPLGIGHRVMQDDIYGDYLIPKGSILMGNTWTLFHNENIYGPNPEAFEPERYFRPGVIDPIGHFGFGRRICPGHHVADNSIFIAVASILKVFDISPARDHNGNEIPVIASFKTGFLSHPEPFHCTIKQRPETVQDIHLNAFEI